MKIRSILLLALLAAFLAGCTVNRSSRYSDFDQPYDDGYYDYRGTPSYEGYYYVRIIFINTVPYYVDDDRYIRPIPPRLHDHFRRYPYNTIGRPPVFSRDTEMRDGYPVSRIIYLDGVPYHVENDRNAQPLPERLRPHFRYTPSDQANTFGNRPQDSGLHDNGRNNEPPVNARDREHERERFEQPPSDHGQREGGSDAAIDSKGRMILSPETPPDHASNRGRDHNGKRPQAIEEIAKKKAEKREEKKKARKDKKDKKDDSIQTEDNSDDQNDKLKKPRNGKNAEQ
jgi:hypothetical protein